MNDGELGDGEPGDGMRQRILRAARVVLAARGMATTVDHVADAAGVSRRTVFRAFTSRDRLIAEAVRDGMRSYAEHLPLHEGTPDLDAWLTSSLVVIHRLNARLGRIYWELAGLGDDLPGEMAIVAEERRLGRVELVGSFATTIWEAAGGDGIPSAWFIDACAVHLSAFSTRALTGDFGRSPEEVAETCARTLAAAVRTAVAERSAVS